MNQLLGILVFKVRIQSESVFWKKNVKDDIKICFLILDGGEGRYFFLSHFFI